MVSEWAAILDTSAVPIISPAAAKDIRKHLSHRIVPSRHVSREKPGEGVGAASKAKCRWCVLGHRDPDIRQLERSSPTPQTSSIYTFLFVAAVLQREVTLGDLKSAFMQSDKDLSERPQGQLYASLLPGGIPLAEGTWVEEGSLVQLNSAVYGLVNAPSAWRKTIVRGMENLGYRRSCCDPCIFCLMDESGPQGHILIEVDDLATHGNAVHTENMAKLQKTFMFGKWKSIYNSEGDYAGRTVIQDQSSGFNVHQAKFVSDRRTAIDIQIIRASMDAQGAMVRWVDHSGMYADAMTKKNGKVPLLQMLLRTGRICITEESITLEKHKSNPTSRNSSSKTHIDPVTQAAMGVQY